MPRVPHNFPTLRQEPDGSGATQRCVVVLGAGFSVGLVPGAKELFEENRASVDAKLNCTTSPAAIDLYHWAGEIISQLDRRNDPLPPTLALAEALGITSDVRWRGGSRDGPVQARHRVLARFARENRLDSLWSLNWDCHQENALERVGFSRDQARPDLPWKTGYTTFVTVADYARLGQQQVFPVFKPHGCVNALLDSQTAFEHGDVARARQLANRFLITAHELRSPEFDPQQTQRHLFGHLETRLAQLPLIAFGWSASEEYLLNLVEARVRPALEARTLAEDELSLVDFTFNGDGHRHLAAAYSRTQDQAHVPVGEKDFTLDMLWLWVHALYSLKRVRACCDPVPVALDEAIRLVKDPCHDHWLPRWADEWLAGWCRLCWRAGCVGCLHNNRLVTPENLDLESPEAHVPLNYCQVPRPDLVASGTLLTCLWEKPARWNFQKFPTALFDNASGRLVIPVPTWRSPAEHADRTLKPLFDLWKGGPLGSIQSVALLELDGGRPPANGALDHWRQAFARKFPHSNFAVTDNIETLNLNQL